MTVVSLSLISFVLDILIYARILVKDELSDEDFCLSHCI